MAITRKKSKAKSGEYIIELLLKTSGISTVFILLGIFAFLCWRSFPLFTRVSITELFGSTVWNPTAFDQPSYGLLSMILSTLMVSIGALILAVPLGIGAAAAISELPNLKLREFFKSTVEILAGIPSVVVGFIGIVITAPLIAKIFNLSNGLNALNGSILLCIMALPTIVSIAEDALFMVPRSYTEASLAMGATRWQTLIKIRLPAAASGLVAAVMLGLGRAIGETMTVLMATGNAAKMPHSFFDSVLTMTATIAIELGEVPYNTTHYFALFGVGLILFLITFSVNLIADIVLQKQQQILQK